MPVIFGAMSIVVRISRPSSGGKKMKEHEFTLILTADPDDEQANKLYGAFNDGTLSTIAGIPQIHFHREAVSLEEAIRSAIGDVRMAGFDVQRVEMQPDMRPV
jgi:hypothetical protein